VSGSVSIVDEAGLSWNEKQRLAALRSYRILDTPPEPEYDDVVRLAAQVCRTPVALITLVDEHRQWFKAEIGLGLRETPLEASICSTAILQPDLFVVRDTTRDERFHCNPLVTGGLKLRFYAGGRSCKPRASCPWAPSASWTARAVASLRSRHSRFGRSPGR
jgi:GAF domain-containing protein